MVKVFKGYVEAEVNNELLDNGFKFLVYGDYEFCETMDGSAGMVGKAHYFDNEEEAKTFAENDKTFGGCIVHNVKHQETEAERIAKEEAKKANKADKENAKAEAMGLTIEEYKAYKKVEEKKKRYAREIAKMREAIAEMEAEINRKQKYIDNN